MCDKLRIMWRYIYRRWSLLPVWVLVGFLELCVVLTREFWKGHALFFFFFFLSFLRVGSWTLTLKNSNEGLWFCLVKWKHVVPCTNLSTAKSLKYIIPCMKLWTIKSILVYGTIGHSTSWQSWNLMWVTLIVNSEKLIGLHR